MNEFSLCAIYKNEAKNLPKFIGDHRDLVEEMVLVDTGSTDESNEIVASFGLTHYFYQWTHHFARARNFSLSLASKPWIIVLDIDEQVLPEDFARLRAVMAEQPRDAYSLKQINFTDEFDDLNWKSITSLPPQFHTIARGYIESPLIRVFRNFSGVCFHGAIHELVGESLREKGLSSCITPIPIYHLGWTAVSRTDEEKQRKQETYRALIRQEWERDPSPKMAFYYLSTLKDAEERLRLCFRLTREHPQVRQFWEVLARTAAELKQWPRALAYTEKGLALFPDFVPLLALKARCLNETAQPDQALVILTQLLVQDPLHPLFWFEKLKALLMLKRVPEVQDMLAHLPPLFPPHLAEEIRTILP